MEYYRAAPWVVLFPGLAIMLIVVCFNLLGAGLRDAMDPTAARGERCCAISFNAWPDAIVLLGVSVITFLLVFAMPGTRPRRWWAAGPAKLD